MTNKLTKMRENNGNICISIIISTKKESPLRQQNESIIKNAFHKFKDILEQKFSKKVSGEYVSKLQNLEKSIEFKRITEGIGIFFNDIVSEIIYFENPVEDKLLIDDNFEIREILIEDKNSLRAYVVLLNETHVRFFETEGENVKEIINDKFPFNIENEFQLPESQNILSRVPEESDINMKRIIAGLREADKNINNFIKNKNLPVIICGLDKTLSAYKKIRNEFPFSYYYAVNFDKSSLKEIGSFIRSLTMQLYENEAQNILVNLQNKADESVFITDIADIWYASLDKKGDKLFISESFTKPAVIDTTTGEIFIENSDTLNGDNYKTIPDIINNIIENVIFSGGKVYFLPEDKMEDYGKVVMSLRYK